MQIAYELKVNVEATVRAATDIKLYNTQMRDGIFNAQAAILQLDGSWDGAAASATINKFHEIKSQYSEARYNVLDNFVNFLLQQVGEGYKQTESANVSLADQFK